MDKNKIVILVLSIIVIALVVGIFALMPNMSKHDTNLTFKSNSTITEGGSIKILLSDINGTPLKNQTVNITIVSKDKSKEYHSVVTNNNGTAKLKVNNGAGEYKVELNYGGNGSYNGCNLTKKLKIEEKVEQVEYTSSSGDSSSSQSQTYASGLTDEEIEAHIQRDLDIRAQNGVKSKYDYQEARNFYENVPPTGMK